MPTLYATLDPLAVPAKLVSGGEAVAINVYRPTFGGFATVMRAENAVGRVRAFIGTACKGLTKANGAAAHEEEIVPESVAMPDIAELVDAMVEMNTASAEGLNDGDGINHPIVYTLRHPLVLDSAGTKLEQIEFSVKTLGGIASFLNARDEGERFREFMRASATLIGVALPITDAVVNAFDIEDYATIASDNILGKLAGSRGRLRKAS